MCFRNIVKALTIFSKGFAFGRVPKFGVSKKVSGARTDTALASAIRDMWVAGVSTRKVERAAADLGLESMSRSRVSRFCASLDDAFGEAAACLSLPREQWRRVRTSSVRERMSAEIKRRTRVVRAFPSAEFLFRLVGAACCD